MYHVSAQGVDKHMINVHYYHYSQQRKTAIKLAHLLWASTWTSLSLHASLSVRLPFLSILAEPRCTLLVTSWPLTHPSGWTPPFASPLLQRLFGAQEKSSFNCCHVYY